VDIISRVDDQELDGFILRTHPTMRFFEASALRTYCDTEQNELVLATYFQNRASVHFNLAYFNHLIFPFLHFSECVAHRHRKSWCFFITQQVNAKGRREEYDSEPLSFFHHISTLVTITL
jgi:hypothetical protein